MQGSLFATGEGALGQCQSDVVTSLTALVNPPIHPPIPVIELCPLTETPLGSRSRPELADKLRVTVGARESNEKFMALVEKYLDDEKASGN